MRATYTAKVTRDGKFWAIEIPELPGVFTQARFPGEIELMARDAIAVMQEVDAGSFDLRIEE